MTRERLRHSIEEIEESYEFFLAFAAQGIRNDRESPSGGQLREFLRKMSEAAAELSHGVAALGDAEALKPPVAWQRYAETVARDAASTHAAVELVRHRTVISSQLVDNLNASIHVRALLTDLFLLDELLKSSDPIS